MDAAIRHAVSAKQLLHLIEGEFKKRRPSDCRKCVVPPPYFVQLDDPGQANWSIGQVDYCSRGCHIALAEILVAMWDRYDLERAASTRRHFFSLF